MARLGRCRGGSLGSGRQEHLEGGTAAGPILHPGPATVELREPAHQRQADPGAGRVRGHGGPLAERFEDRLAEVLVDARPVVFDGEQGAVVMGFEANPDRAVARRVPGGVHREVLDDALQLRRIHPQHHGADVDHHGAFGERIEALDRAPGQGADVGGAVLRLHDASVEPVDVEEVLQQTVQLAGVRGDPFLQVDPILGVHVRRAFQRDRQPQDRGERAPELVRDGGEERVLHLVEGSQSFGRFPLTLFGFAQRLLGELALGDVHQDALEVGRIAVLVVQERRLVVHPDRATVAREHPVLGVPRRPSAMARR